MSILQALKYTSEYGVPLVLSAVVVYLIVKFANLQFEKEFESVRNKKHDKLLEMRQEIDEQVYELIQRFLADHNGTRVQVVEFTNSVTSVAFLPFRFMTCTYEVVSYGTKPEAKSIDKLSTSLFTPFLCELSKKGYMVLDDIRVDHLSGAVHDLYDNIGSAYQICSILRSERCKSIGYVSLCTDSLKDEEQNTADIRALGSQLSALLGVLDS